MTDDSLGNRFTYHPPDDGWLWWAEHFQQSLGMRLATLNVHTNQIHFSLEQYVRKDDTDG